MAEINIEQRERSAWPWILGLLVLALLAWWLLAMRDGGNDNVVVADTSAGVIADPVAAAREPMPAAVSEFLRYTEEHRAAPAADSTHNYEAEGVRRLAAALDEIAVRDTIGRVALDTRITALRERADALERSWRSTEHARHTRTAFDSAAALIENMQATRFADLSSEATAVRQAAAGVAPERPLLEQTDAVRRFFERAADAVRAMAGTTSSNS